MDEDQSVRVTNEKRDAHSGSFHRGFAFKWRCTLKKRLYFEGSIMTVGIEVVRGVNMKKLDLIELLRSTIEGDALVSRLYNLFHLHYGYSINELNTIIKLGTEKGYFSIENVCSSEKKYNDIEWVEDNIYQEIVMNDEGRFIASLFSEEAHIPEEFVQFLEQ